MKNFNPNELKGKEKVNRMFELMSKLTPKNSVNKTQALEFIKEGPDKKVYNGIVRENKKYYIKSTEKQNNVISEDFEYIGGLKKSQDYAFDSYSEALKQLNFMFIDIANKTLTENNSANFAISDKNLISEEKRYKMKIKGAAPAAAPTPPPAPAPAPATPAPAGAEDAGMPAPDMGGGLDTAEPTPDMGNGEDMPTGDDNNDTGAGGNDGGNDEIPTKRDVQKITGKLGQEIRDMDKNEKDDDLMKYVVNSILGAVDMTLVSDEDKEKFIDKIEKSMDDDDDSDGDSEDMGDDIPADDDSEASDLNEDIFSEVDALVKEMTQNLRGYFDTDDESDKRDRYKPGSID